MLRAPTDARRLATMTPLLDDGQASSSATGAN